MLNPYEKATLLHLINKLETTTPCNACIHFEQGKCRRWGEMIPEDTLPVGCSEFAFNEKSCPF